MIFGGSALTHPAETEQLSGTTIAMAIHGALALCLFVLYVTGYATPILTRVAEVIT
jgi:cytochrome b561